MEATFSFVNGELLESSLAKVSIFDHGFTVADGVFETLKLASGAPFALSRHLRRLENSCRGLGILFPKKAELIDAIDLVATKNKHLKNGRMRITLTSGEGPLGSDRLSKKPSIVISVAAQKDWPARGDVLLVPWIRNERSPLISVKTTSYAENVYALAAAHKHGYSEAIFLNSIGFLTEGTGSNVFLIKNGQISTPKVSNGILAGITRQLIIEWLSGEFTVDERDLTESEIFEADELFLTSSTRGVQGISQLAKLTSEQNVIQEIRLPFGKVTNEVLQIFSNRSNEQIDP